MSVQYQCSTARVVQLGGTAEGTIQVATTRTDCSLLAHAGGGAEPCQYDWHSEDR